MCSFLKGDMFIVHNELDDGWMWVTNVRTEEQGLIVEDLVEEVVSIIFFMFIKHVSKHKQWYEIKLIVASAQETVDQKKPALSDENISKWHQCFYCVIGPAVTELLSWHISACDIFVGAGGGSTWGKSVSIIFTELTCHSVQWLMGKFQSRMQKFAWLL